VHKLSGARSGGVLPRKSLGIWGPDETAFYDPRNSAFSNGAHVRELEIDPETGHLQIVGSWVVDDVGIVINPMIVEGQVHGGLAQGSDKR
jgi:carbon-monoxide dehydrogenase large subunit